VRSRRRWFGGLSRFRGSPVRSAAADERGWQQSNIRLQAVACLTHAPRMFVVTEADAAAIRAAFDRGGELSAAIELRRLFPGITDNVQARECARAIAGWKPLPVKPVRRLRPRGCRSGV
jgi:hypothetical protein